MSLMVSRRFLTPYLSPIGRIAEICSVRGRMNGERLTYAAGASGIVVGDERRHFVFNLDQIDFGVAVKTSGTKELVSQLRGGQSLLGIKLAIVHRGIKAGHSGAETHVCASDPT